MILSIEWIENSEYGMHVNLFARRELHWISLRELTEQFLRGTLGSVKLLDQYEAACKVRRLVPRTIQTYRRWVEESLRFHHDRTGC